jgi:hypothetical protein
MSDRPSFDPESTWKPLEERLARETDPRRRKLLEEVRDHMRNEITGDLEGLMNTLTAEPQYHLWGVGEEGGPKGRSAVEVFYRKMIDTGGNRFHFDIRRIVVDEDSVVTEGKMRTTMPGAALVASGVQEVDGEPVDADGQYLAEWQILTVWPADEDGKLIGEDIYFGSDPMKSLSRL